MAGAPAQSAADAPSDGGPCRPGRGERHEQEHAVGVTLAARWLPGEMARRLRLRAVRLGAVRLRSVRPCGLRRRDVRIDRESRHPVRLPMRPGGWYVLRLAAGAGPGVACALGVARGATHKLWARRLGGMSVIRFRLGSGGGRRRRRGIGRWLDGRWRRRRRRRAICRPRGRGSGWPGQGTGRGSARRSGRGDDRGWRRRRADNVTGRRRFDRRARADGPGTHCRSWRWRGGRRHARRCGRRSV
jgi:hypothetical protein